MPQQLLELYSLDEMARTRGDATWAVLDWCASQKSDVPGEPATFTINDMYKVYTAAGGLSGATSFATLINHFVSKYDPNAEKAKHRNREKYGLSQKRPLVRTRIGRQGKGGEARYQWGLDGPLREPPPNVDPADRGNEEDDSPVAAAMDNLERLMGGPALKAAMDRWKKMGDLRRITVDIRAGIPPKGQMDAMLIASEPLMASGKADAEDVENAEESLPPSDDQEPPRTPFSPGRPRTDLPQAQAVTRRSPAPTKSAPEPVEDDPAAEWEDDSADKTQPDIANPFAQDASGDEGPSDVEPSEDEPKGSEGDTDEYDTSDYPDWLPPAKRNGTAGERGMFRLVDSPDAGGAALAPDDRLWQSLGQADDEGEALAAVQKLFGRPGYDRKHLKDALAVAREVMSGTGNDDSDDADSNEEPEVDSNAPDDTGQEPSDQLPPEETDGYPEWLPQPDEEGGNAENAMFRLVDEGDFREENPFYTELRNARDSVDAHRIITSSKLPRNLTKSALTVAKAIFQHDGRDWDTGEKVGGPKQRKEGRGRLATIFMVNEMTDDDVVPDPSKRPVPGPTRTLPDYGMDEGPNTDPVDFAQRSGLQRVMKAVRK